MPATPRGPRRRVSPEAVALLLPRLDPAWELSALLTLMKPPRRAKVVSVGGASAQQVPAAGWRAEVEARALAAAGRLAIAVELEWPEAGDFWAVARLPGADGLTYRAMAAVLSRATPGLAWKLAARGSLGSLVVRDGRFYRRARRVSLELTAARDVHLPRELRAKLADLLGARGAEGVGGASLRERGR